MCWRDVINEISWYVVKATGALPHAANGVLCGGSSGPIVATIVAYVAAK